MTSVLSQSSNNASIMVSACREIPNSSDNNNSEDFLDINSKDNSDSEDNTGMTVVVKTEILTESSTNKTELCPEETELCPEDDDVRDNEDDIKPESKILDQSDSYVVIPEIVISNTSTPNQKGSLSINSTLSPLVSSFCSKLTYKESRTPSPEFIPNLVIPETKKPWNEARYSRPLRGRFYPRVARYNRYNSKWFRPNRSIYDAKNRNQDYASYSTYIPDNSDGFYSEPYEYDEPYSYNEYISNDKNFGTMYEPYNWVDYGDEFQYNKRPASTYSSYGRGRSKSCFGSQDTEYPYSSYSEYQSNMYSDYQSPNFETNGYHRGRAGRGRLRFYKNGFRGHRPKYRGLRGLRNFRHKPSFVPNRGVDSNIQSYYYRDDPSTKALTVDVGTGLSNFEECTNLNAFCSFGLSPDWGQPESDDTTALNNSIEFEGTPESGSESSKDVNEQDSWPFGEYTNSFDGLEQEECGHVVYFHINPGTTVNFTNIEGETHKISGPATVRMVSTNSSPPIPLPVQMPPGHVVQQIVDECGTLQHVILSAQPMGMPVCSYGPNTGQGPPQFYSHPPGPPPQGYMPSYQPGPHYPPVMSPPITQPSPPPPHNYVKGDRGGSRHHEKLRTKFYQHQSLAPQGPPHTSHSHHFPPHSHHHYPSSHHPPLLLNNHSHAPPLSPKKDFSLPHKGDISGESLNGELSDGAPPSLQEVLSHVPDLEVSEVSPFGALVNWSPPDLSPLALKPPPEASIRYDIFLNSSVYGSVTSPENSIQVNNLKPGTEYKIYLICNCDGVRGFPTPKKVFQTKATIPDKPLPPRVVDRKKHSVILKWIPTKDNGAKIQYYTLDMSGVNTDSWSQVYRGRGREYSINKLKPQTTYRFRLCATNDVGTSNFSSDLVVSTMGLAPPQPSQPTLDNRGVTSLTLGWASRPCDEAFALEMDDPHTEYGFIPVFDGVDNFYTCHDLERNSDYKFRLCARNENGKSPYSEVASYRTLPDLPQPPGPPTLKGTPLPDRFTVTWLPPRDNGGIPISGYSLQIRRDSGFETVYSGVQGECQVSGLHPGSLYAIRVRAEGPGGKSNWSAESALATSPVKPGSCRPPRLQGKPKAHALSLKWGYPEVDGGSPVQEYHVDMITPDSERRQVYVGRETECTVASLLPGRAYMFLLQAVNKVGEGPWSEPFEVVSGAGPPDCSKAPHLACKGPHVVHISWDEPINNGARVEVYTVQMAETSCPNVESSESSWTSGGENDADLAFAKVHSGSGRSTDIKGLAPASMYAFRVCASNSVGSGPFSSSSLITTPASAPGSVSHLKATPEATQISLQWAEPPNHGDPVTHYRIEYGDQSVSTHGPQLEYLLKGLQASSSYKIRIQAVNGMGSGPLSSTHKVTTLSLPPPPPHLELLKASFNSIRLKWGDGRNPNLHKYTLQMEFPNHHTKQLEFYQIYSGLNQSFKVCRLEENASYRFCICAANEAGVGSNSRPVQFSTTKAPPPPLKAPRVSETPGTPGSYCVEWCGVDVAGDDSAMYRLQLMHSTKDSDYNMVFKGEETKFTLTGLVPQSSYLVRVGAVRVNPDKEVVVAGAYSSPTLFNTRRGAEDKHPAATDVKQTSMQKPIPGGVPLRWGRMSDHQKAFVILSLFAFFAFITAYVLSPEHSQR